MRLLFTGGGTFVRLSAILMMLSRLISGGGPPFIPVTDPIGPISRVVVIFFASSSNFGTSLLALTCTGKDPLANFSGTTTGFGFDLDVVPSLLLCELVEFRRLELTGDGGCSSLS